VDWGPIDLGGGVQFAFVTPFNAGVLMGKCTKLYILKSAFVSNVMPRDFVPFMYFIAYFADSMWRGGWIALILCKHVGDRG